MALQHCSEILERGAIVDSGGPSLNTVGMRIWDSPRRSIHNSSPSGGTPVGAMRRRASENAGIRKRNLGALSVFCSIQQRFVRFLGDTCAMLLLRPTLYVCALNQTQH